MMSWIAQLVGCTAWLCELFLFYLLCTVVDNLSSVQPNKVGGSSILYILPHQATRQVPFCVSNNCSEPKEGVEVCFCRVGST